MEQIQYVLTEYTIYLAAAWMGFMLIFMVTAVHRINKIHKQLKKYTGVMQDQMNHMISSVQMQDIIADNFDAASQSQRTDREWTKEQEELISSVLGEVFP